MSTTYLAFSQGVVIGPFEDDGWVGDVAEDVSKKI
jgi:hypothetical protein